MDTIEMLRYRIIERVMVAGEGTLDQIERVLAEPEEVRDEDWPTEEPGYVPPPSLVVTSADELRRRIEESRAQVARGEFVTAEDSLRSVDAILAGDR